MVSNSAHDTATVDNSVATRYGKAKRRRFSKTSTRLIAILALLAAVGVALWFTMASTSSMLAYKTAGYSIESETEAWVEFELTKESESTVACAIRVLSDTAAIAGYRTVIIGPDEDSTGVGKDLTKYYDAPLRTDQLGASGQVETCWYVEAEESPNISNFRDY